MAGKALTRKSKAATLVPLALVCGLWTASIASAGTTAIAAKSDDSPLPDGTAVPSRAIEAPASVPVPGAIAPTVPNGTEDQVVSSASTNGIPSAALSAYQRGAQIMDAADTKCNIPWELIAAIGRVESNHGLFGGNTLTEDGVSTPGIFGPQLNGQNGTQAISDTDGGELDKDTVYDRAVGPMQFIPSTWSVVKVDADGDGTRNPQDIDDAGLASAVYLCSGDDDLATRTGQETAVYRYNHSRSYVNLVLRIMEAYSQGDYSAIPSGTYGGNTYTPSFSTAIDQQQETNEAKPRPSTGPGAPATQPGGGSGGGQPPASTPPGDDDEGDGDPVDPPGPGDGGSDPIDDAINDTVTKVTDSAGSVTEPVVDTLSTLSEATGFCSGQLSSVPLIGSLLGTATPACASRVQGMTESDAAAVIPNTLDGVVSWLGL